MEIYIGDEAVAKSGYEPKYSYGDIPDQNSNSCIIDVDDSQTFIVNISNDVNAILFSTDDNNIPHKLVYKSDNIFDNINTNNVIELINKAGFDNFNTSQLFIYQSDNNNGKIWVKNNDELLIAIQLREETSDNQLCYELSLYNYKDLIKDNFEYYPDPDGIEIMITSDEYMERHRDEFM